MRGLFLWGVLGVWGYFIWVFVCLVFFGLGLEFYGGGFGEVIMRSNESCVFGICVGKEYMEN